MSLVSIFLSEMGAGDPIRNLSLTATSPVQGGLRDVASPVNDIFSGITDRGDLTDENERLKARVEELEAQLAQQQDAQLRIHELEDALGVRQSRQDDVLEAANVIGEDTQGLKRFIAIDRGASDGLQEGMVVLSRKGSLIGTIATTYDDFAWIQLITDPDSAVNVQVAGDALVEPAPAAPQVLTPGTPTPQASAGPPGSATPAPEASANLVRAVAKGELRKGLLLDLIPSNASLAKGDLVVTSGHGGNYPRGILVGSVADVQERPQAPFKSADVDPAADLTGLDTVLILTSFTPARLTSP